MARQRWKVIAAALLRRNIRRNRLNPEFREVIGTPISNPLLAECVLIVRDSGVNSVVVMAMLQAMVRLPDLRKKPGSSGMIRLWLRHDHFGGFAGIERIANRKI